MTKPPEGRLLSKWHRCTDLLRLAYASKFVINAAAPINIMLLGSPGDGKSTLLSRFVELPGVCEIDNFTQTSLYAVLDKAVKGEVKVLVISDFGTLVNKKAGVSEPALALLAAATSNGVGLVTTGPSTKRHFQHVTLSVLTAITPIDFRRRQTALSSNALLTRFFVIDFTLSQQEQEAYLNLKYRGDDRLMRPVRRLELTGRNIDIAQRYVKIAMGWWRQMRLVNPQPVAGMRTADSFVTLLRTAALLRGANRVGPPDIKLVGKMQSVWEDNPFTERDTVSIREAAQPFKKVLRGRKRKK